MDLLEVKDRPNNGDLEDPEKLYATLGCNKASSDEDIGRGFKRIKKALQGKMLKYHPDKSSDPNDKPKYDAAKAKYDKLRRAHKELGTPGDDGTFPGRVAYDKRGEELREKMVAVSIPYHFFYAAAFLSSYR
jgi:curved DNA-binding protein CbpA